jgi:hypothetical protein
LKNLRIIGGTCYVNVPKQGRKKMDKKAIKGFLIGYSGDDGYHVWCKETNTLIRSSDVVFEERIPQHRIYEMPVIEDPQDAKVQIPVKTEEEEEKFSEERE